MNFTSIKQRNEFFDLIIDCYNKSNYEEADTYIRVLNSKQDREFLYYIYGLDKNVHLYSFILDAIF
jgi:hypothetical protein